MSNLNQKAIVIFFQLLGHTQQCSGLTPGSVLNNNFWKCSGLKPYSILKDYMQFWELNLD